MDGEDRRGDREGAGRIKALERAQGPGGSRCPGFSYAVKVGMALYRLPHARHRQNRNGFRTL